MRGKQTLLWKQTLSQPKVQEFLSSIARNSLRSKEAYCVGLSHFQTFLHYKYSNSEFEGHNLENILEPILKNKINVYTLLDNFVSYMLSRKASLSPNSIALYIAAIRSYLSYYDVDIVPSKFKRRVRLPKNHREDEEPLDAADIRRILLACNNRRIKAYLLVLASGGMRTIEALAIRIKDIDFSVSPTRIHIRKEFAKTRVARDIYISGEATEALMRWLKWKYRKREKKDQTPEMKPDDIVFTRVNFMGQVTPIGLYRKVAEEFRVLLKSIGMDELKEGMNRRKITMHSLRRYVKTVISTQANPEYSEYYLGHSKSPYWVMKEEQRREIYASRLMRSLTFLDYTTLELSGKNVEARLEEKEKEIAYLREREINNADAISILRTQVDILMSSAKGLDDSGKQKMAENMISRGIYLKAAPREVD